jgi:hypothetical protein
MEPLRIKRGTEPRKPARRLIDALSKGETGACVAYRRSHNRSHDRVDAVLAAIDDLVRADFPDVECAPLHYGDEERLWVWSLGEPEGFAFWPRQKPEEGVALFPKHEPGSQEVEWRAAPRARQEDVGPLALTPKVDPHGPPFRGQITTAL